MKIISTHTHGILDYIMGVVLIIAPFILGFAEGGAETWVPVILGISTIIYSLLTDYELGASRQISMKTHLTLDTVSAIILAASPWIFGFADFVFWPHLILGILELGAVAMTESSPRYEENREINDQAHRTQVEQNSASAYKREQKVDKERPAPSSQTKVSPQATASTQMHAKERNEEHKSGIYHEGKRAAEPQSETDDLKNNDDQISRSNINHPKPNQDQNNIGRQQENYKSRRPVGVENSLHKDNSDNSSGDNTNNRDVPSSQTKQNLSSKTEDPTQPNKNNSPDRNGNG